MAVTNKGSKWELKNSLYVIFALFPVLNCAAFFHMSGRVKNKKWNIMGWVILILNIVLLISTFLSQIVYCPYTQDLTKKPKVEDYCGKNYYNDPDYRDSDEYALYEEAYDEWKALPEVKEIDEKINTFYRNKEIVIGVLMSATLLFNLVILIDVAFVEKPKYLRALANQSNKDAVAERMKSFSGANTAYGNYITPNAHGQQSQNNYASVQNYQNTPAYQQPVYQQNAQPMYQPVQNTQPAQSNQQARTIVQNSSMLDINSMTEEQFASLRGLTIIDAKKAVSYRNEHGGFNSVDEFFSVIKAKPHIIVGIENQLFAGNFNNAPQKKNEHTSSRRQLDL